MMLARGEPRYNPPVTPLPLLLLLGLAQVKPPSPPPELAATFQYSLGSDLVSPWQTYAVDLASRATRELDLTIRIEDDSFLAVATRRERLPAAARKRVFLYAPGAGFPRGVPARWRITDARGTELLTGTLPSASRSHVQNAFQIGLFCRIPAAEDDFGIPGSLNSLDVRAVRIGVDTFPDRWIGLAALDLLVLHDAPLDELTTDQARALSDYVRQGGTVLLTPGASPGWLSHPTLALFAPVRAGPPRQVTALPGINAAYGPFRRADPFLVQPLTNGAPAMEGVHPQIGREIARFDAGFGRAFVVGCDLRRPPFDTWAGRRGLWNDLLLRSPRWFQEDASAFPPAATPQQREGLFQQMARLINPYPSFGLILGLAILFLVVVGPLNYTILGRLRRTLLLVVTVPGISLAFLGLIVMLGYGLKGTSTVVHSARLLSTRSGLDSAREIHLFTLFSPSTRTYDLDLEPGSFGPHGRWTTWENQNYNRRRESLPTLTCETGTGLGIRGLSTGQWQNWEMETRAIRDLGKGVRFTVEGGRLKIDNGSARAIERGVYFQTGFDAQAVPFGAVDPGRSAELPIPPSPSAPGDIAGFPPGSLGECVLRAWVEPLTSRPAPGSAAGQPQRFLLCVLKDEGAPVTVKSGTSGRSQSVTLLHVMEAP